MSSIEKKEIVQNGIFGVVAGLAMAGPAGALTVGLAAAGMAHIQEQKDEEQRQRNWELFHPDPVEKELERQRIKEYFQKERLINKDLRTLMVMERPGKITDSIFYDDTYKELSGTEKYNLMKSLNKRIDDYYQKYDRCYAKIDFDFIRNSKRGKLDPNNNPYVNVTRFNSRSDYKYGTNPSCVGRGKIYKSEEFKRMLLDDYYNPNIEKYSILSSTVTGCINDNHLFFYMYTIDGGETYVLCW